jgi:hypothetical protein
MKRSNDLQQKLNDMAERRRLKAMSSYLEGIATKYDIKGEFASKQVININPMPVEYISSRKYLADPIEALDISNTSQELLLERIVFHLQSYDIAGDALFYLSDEAFGGEWLKIDKNYLKKLVCNEIANSSHSKQLEFLVACTGTNTILALFEEEYEYLVCKFAHKS